MVSCSAVFSAHFFFEKKDIAAHITFHFFLHEIDTLLVFLLVIRNTVC